LTLFDYSLLVKRNWKEIWRDKNFRIHFLATPFYIIVLACFFPWFFDFVEARDGKTLGDIILDFLPAKDVSRLIFICLYTGMLLSMTYLVAHPRQLILTLQTYCLVTTMRIFSITIFPLHPPADYIPLKEPIAQLLTNGDRIISKDLFFSGHVATILSLYYPLQNKIIRWILLSFSVMVGVLVLIQHAHYTIDVLMAAFATYVCYLLSLRITRKIKQQPVKL
jgi:hypothetical protein